jgi:hypothetical protein
MRYLTETHRVLFETEKRKTKPITANQPRGLKTSFLHKTYPRNGNGFPGEKLTERNMKSLERECSLIDEMSLFFTNDGIAHSDLFVTESFGTRDERISSPSGCGLSRTRNDPPLVDKKE